MNLLFIILFFIVCSSILYIFSHFRSSLIDLISATCVSPGTGLGSLSWALPCLYKLSSPCWPRHSGPGVVCCWFMCVRNWVGCRVGPVFCVAQLVSTWVKTLSLLLFNPESGYWMAWEQLHIIPKSIYLPTQKKKKHNHV